MMRALRQHRVCTAMAVALLVVIGCGPSAETAKKETAVPATKEELFQAGHRLYLQRQYDSAAVLLSRAVSLDSTFSDAIADLASLYYERASAEHVATKKAEYCRRARDYYVKLEAFGSTDADTYERLCEIADALNDHRTFLVYAQKNARLYPYDRQYYNLCVAYFAVADYQSVIKVCKEAIERFPSSPFIGTFYRQLGRGYMKVDRDQTAERTFYTGLSVIEKRMNDIRKRSASYDASPEYQRMKDDAIGILTSLKYLHTTYKASEKLAEVEKKLKELGQ